MGENKSPGITKLGKHSGITVGAGGLIPRHAGTGIMQIEASRTGREGGAAKPRIRRKKREAQAHSSQHGYHGLTFYFRDNFQTGCLNRRRAYAGLDRRIRGIMMGLFPARSGSACPA
jgi:hypothetical protein